MKHFSAYLDIDYDYGVSFTELFVDIMILFFAVVGVCQIFIELSRFLLRREGIKGRVYIICFPHTDNIEGFCRTVTAKFRKNGCGEDIMIVGDSLDKEQKKIGRLFESACNGVFIINKTELDEIYDLNLRS